MERYKSLFMKTFLEGKSELYVDNSSIFDSHPYDIPKIIKALKGVGAKNIRTDNNFGWSNQPEVVIFSGIDEETAKNAVEKALRLKWIMIRELNW